MRDECVHDSLQSVDRTEKGRGGFSSLSSFSYTHQFTLSLSSLSRWSTKQSHYCNEIGGRRVVHRCKLIPSIWVVDCFALQTASCIATFPLLSSVQRNNRLIPSHTHSLETKEELFRRQGLTCAWFSHNIILLQQPKHP